MRTLRLYLDDRQVEPNQPAPIRIRITKNRQSSYITTEIKVKRTQWDADQEMIVFHPKARMLNLHLAQRMDEIENILLEHHVDFRPLTASQIIKAIKDILSPSADPKDLFYDYAVRFMESKEKPRTRDIYAATLSRIRDYTPQYKELRFADITPLWLRDFDLFLSENAPSRNARNIHFRNIRAVFNDAIDEEVTSYYPFRKFKIKHEQTVKRSLTVEQMATFFLADPEEYAVKYHDMFKLMFYLIGINTVDLCNLREIIAGRIEYHREKTGRLYTIKVEPEAMEIIEKYQGEKYLVNILDHYKSYLSFGRQMNMALHAMGKKLDGSCRNKTFSGITTYWARHTWATLAAELDIPKETIARALGHGGNDVTDVYIRYDDKKIDRANRQVIDYLHEHIEKIKTEN